MRLPSLKPKEVVAILKKAGFIAIRQSGSHLTLANKVNKKVAVVPLHSKEMKRGLLVAIVKQSGLTQEEFIELLK
ncbi:MAG: type II toxin-antitoxin system HicA family toxin [bacterium]|nr:type II toxin-antitoxin system HicA family toxin [bacterium]